MVAKSGKLLMWIFTNILFEETNGATVKRVTYPLKKGAADIFAAGLMYIADSFRDRQDKPLTRLKNYGYSHIENFNIFELNYNNK
jgi:hypothetical protein